MRGKNEIQIIKTDTHIFNAYILLQVVKKRPKLDFLITFLLTGRHCTPAAFPLLPHSSIIRFFPPKLDLKLS